jgi:predicted RNA-binding Zn ribbon-like protein
VFAGVVARYDLPKLAPEPLRTVQQFVNTVDREHGREWLGTPAELRSWLADHGIVLGATPKPSERRRALELREALRALARGNRGDAIDDEAREIVNNAARAARLTFELRAEGGVDLRPATRGINAALGELVAIAFGAMLDGTWERLKPCRQCNWLYYDYSRNRAATWCSMQICGNRRKTRAYRARKVRPT